MAGITVSGIGSGLDINTIVSDLITAERSPVETRLDNKEATLQAKLSAMGTFKSAVSDFQSALSGVNSSAAFQSMTTSISDTTLFTASATSVAQAGDYSIGVTQLAQSHKLVTASGLFSSTTSTVGTGTLNFEFGSYDNADNTGDNPTGTGTFTLNSAKIAQTVTIDSSNNTLSGVRDAINSADIGVRASIVYDGSSYRLTLTSTDSGAKNSLRITVTDDDSTNTDMVGLSVLAYDPTNGTPVANLTRTVQAQDAMLTVDGVSVTSASNSVVGAVPGVTLTLKKTGATSTLSVAQDASATEKAVNDFVTAYNQLATTAKSLTAYNASDTTQNGVLLGDFTVTSVMRRINTILTSTVTGATGAPRSLADVGVSLQKDGSLELDSDKLQAALAQSPQAVAALFTRTGVTTDSLVSFNSTKTNSASATGTYNIFVSQLATQGQYVGVNTGLGGAFTIDNTNHSFGIKVNGSSATITLTDGSYTGAALAAQLQSQINANTTLSRAGASVSVSYNAGTDAFTLTSNTYGSTSKVSFTTTNAYLGLGSAIGSSTTGVDVAGAIGEGSQTATQGQYTGAALGAGVGSFTIIGGSDTFAIKINGIQSDVITLDGSGSPYTGAALAAQLQSQINADGNLINASASVSVSYDSGSGQFVLTSNAYGSSSKIEFTQINAALGASLGISVGSGTAGQAGASIATGSGRTLIGVGKAVGIAVDVLGGAATAAGSSRGTVSLSNGAAYQLDTLLSDFLDSSGTLDSRIEGLNRQIEQISDQRTALDTRMTALEARYRAQFTAMDTLISQLTATSNYLTQLFSNSNNNNNNNNN